ncbi:MAG TPA: hypothetical protein VK395_10495 [Gemmataceae bacterium]|nr:hypothetical protein [Gemmataceae bacterium]
MKRTLILLAFLAGCCIMWETATADPGGGKPPPHPLPPTPSFKPAPHIVGHKVTPHPASSDFHLPENFHALGPLPKVTLPKGPSFGGGTLDLKGLNLPHESGLLAYQPKLPSGFKPISGMEFHKNLSGAMLKHPTKIDDVNLSLKKFHSHTLLVKKNLHKHYLMNPWFAQNWWLNHNFVYPYWHYFHHFHLHPPWWWWQHAAWIDCIHWMVYDWGDPFYYDCGVNILYRDNWVYVNDVAVATSIDYAYQAFQLAAVPPPPPEENLEWMPLGVYTLASSRMDPDPDLILQLALSKGGLISGTLYNRTTNVTVAVSGRVEPQTQRVAIQLSDNGDIVMDTGFYNLTLPYSCVFMHFGVLQTQTWFLVHLDPLPKE